MTQKIEIPSQVIDAFTELIEMYGNCIEYLGEINNKRFYWLNIPEDIDSGFPHVVYFKNDKVKDVVGFDALKNLSLFDAEKA